MSDDQILKTPEKGKGTLESPVIQNVENEIQTPPMVVRYNFFGELTRPTVPLPIQNEFLKSLESNSATSNSNDEDTSKSADDSSISTCLKDCRKRNNVDDFESGSDSENSVSSDDDDEVQYQNVKKLRKRKPKSIKNKVHKKRFRKMYLYMYTVRQKVEIVLEANSKKNNKRATARKYEIKPGALYQWEKNLIKLKEKILVNPNAFTTNKGKAPVDVKMEDKLSIWFEELRKEDT